MSLSSAQQHELVTKMLGLGAQHGLDPKRIEAVAVRLGKVESVNGYYPLFNVLEQSIAALGAKEALHYLESQDRDVLAKRVAALRFLTNHDPLYGLEELVNLAAAMRHHLEDNRHALITTGYPQSSFAPSLWLDSQCNRLYPTKLPVTVQGRRPWQHLEEERLGTAERDQAGNFLCAYTWAQQSALGTKAPPGNTLTPTQERPDSLMITRGYLWRDDNPHSQDFQPVTLVPYEQAALIDGLGTQDATRLEGLRESVFSLKLEILEHLQRGVTARNPQALWDRCLMSLTNTLLAEDADYLLTCDKLYERIHPAGVMPSFPDRPFYYATGGLSDLLRLMSHYESELRIGMMWKLREAWNRLDLPDPPYSYYRALGQPWQAQLNAILDEFLSREQENQAFFDQYVTRVNQAVSEEFYVTTQYGERKIPRKANADFIERMQLYEHTEAHHLKTHGALTTLSSPAPSLPASPLLPGKYSEPGSQPAPAFPTPAGTSWCEVKIRFITPEKAKITAGHATKDYTFQEMGLRDRRSGDTPNIVWRILKTLFANRQEVSWETRDVDLKTQYN